jgi:predicted membrane protein
MKKLALLMVALFALLAMVFGITITTITPSLYSLALVVLPIAILFASYKQSKVVNPLNVNLDY